MLRRPTLVVALLLGASVVFQPFRAFAYTVFRAPLALIRFSAQLLVWLPSAPALIQRQAALQQALTSRQLELIRLRETIRRLTRSQHLQEAAAQPGVVASILGRTLLPTEQIVMVDRGARDGLVPDAVVVEERGLVGRVLQTQSQTSTVVLVTDPAHRVAGLVERSRESGLLMGTGGAILEFVYLDLEADVEVGDEVVTAGLGGPFPKGVPVGTVVRLDRDERRASTTAWIRPAVKFGRLEEVLCLPPEKAAIE